MLLLRLQVGVIVSSEGSRRRRLGLKQLPPPLPLPRPPLQLGAPSFRCHRLPHHRAAAAGILICFGRLKRVMVVVVTVVVIPQDEAFAELPEGEGCLHFEPNHPATATPKLSSKHLPANTHTLFRHFRLHFTHNKSSPPVPYRRLYSKTATAASSFFQFRFAAAILELASANLLLLLLPASVNVHNLET